MGSTLVKLEPTGLGSNIFWMTVMDPSLKPEHPIVIPKPPEKPPGIWGGGNEPFPTPPISGIPGLPGYEPPRPPDHIWGGGNEPFPTPPIVIPPPNWKPPEGVEPPGPGEIKPIGGLQPVQPITMPDFILVKYPGYGWVAVGKPVPPTEPEKK